MNYVTDLRLSSVLETSTLPPYSLLPFTHSWNQMSAIAATSSQYSRFYEGPSVHSPSSLFSPESNLNETQFQLKLLTTQFPSKVNNLNSEIFKTLALKIGQKISRGNNFNKHETIVFKSRPH